METVDCCQRPGTARLGGWRQLEDHAEPKLATRCNAVEITCRIQRGAPWTAAGAVETEEDLLGPRCPRAGRRHQLVGSPVAVRARLIGDAVATAIGHAIEVARRVEGQSVGRCGIAVALTAGHALETIQHLFRPGA